MPLTVPVYNLKQVEALPFLNSRTVELPSQVIGRATRARARPGAPGGPGPCHSALITSCTASASVLLLTNHTTSPSPSRATGSVFNFKLATATGTGTHCHIRRPKVSLPGNVLYSWQDLPSFPCQALI